MGKRWMAALMAALILFAFSSGSAALAETETTLLLEEPEQTAESEETPIPPDETIVPSDPTATPTDTPVLSDTPDPSLTSEPTSTPCIEVTVTPSPTPTPMSSPTPSPTPCLDYFVTIVAQDSTVAVGILPFLSRISHMPLMKRASS